MLQIYEIQSVVQMVKEIAMQLRKDEIDIEVVNEISGVMIEINSLLYHATKLKFQKEHDFSIQEEYNDWLSELNKTLKYGKKVCKIEVEKRQRQNFGKYMRLFYMFQKKKF